MSLRILFADDSMTAQNMGKKILSEAGYDVVAVSNGAAAVKKIAEQKPDIIILDVYMPGYSGLEVCEKVRGSLDTLKTPVLLTVGKMEPYKPEDANRVKADGVIIKPFEASDLLAIVKKFEERINSAPPPPLVKPAAVEKPYEEDETTMTQAEIPAESGSSGKTGMQPMVEVPDHMASAAAFGDMLGSEPVSPASHFAVNTPSAAFETSVIVPAPPMPVTADYEVMPPALEEIVAAPVREEIPGFEQESHEGPAMAPPPPPPPPEAVMPEIDAAPEAMVTPVEDTTMETAEPPALQSPVLEPEPAAQAPHPQFIPVFEEPAASEPDYAFIPTAAPPIDDLDIRREPALQETAEETTRSTRADLIEPGLLSSIGQQLESLSAASVEAVAAPPPTEIVAPPPMPEPFASAMPEAAPPPMPEVASSETSSTEAGYSAPAPAGNATPELTDADFEARVAAAMAAYSHTSEAEAAAAPVAESEVTAEPANSPASAEVYAVPVMETREVGPEEATGVPSVERQPPVGDEAVASNAAPPEPVTVSADVPEAAHAAVAAVEAAIPEVAAAAAADSGADHHTIAQAIHRVMERLKPELVEEIMRELRPKK